MNCLTNGGTQEAKKSTRLEVRVQAVSWLMSQMLIAYTTSCDGEGSLVPKFLTSHCQEKLLGRDIEPVPQTDTGRRDENSKALERTLVKELGKIVP